MQYRLLALLVCLAVNIYSQNSDPVLYPAGYFRNPLNIPLRLSGNFGELRSNHYHMGLDIRTLKENLPVHAAAGGYIARIKIEPGGFGRAIYINHPNGYTTLYAHLNNFNKALESWVKKQQYEQESWNVMLEVPAGLFPVKKGDFIAYSGNTGGSQAPHLHFEIRRTADDVNLNPLLFGFSLADKVPPRVARLAVYDRTRSVYEQTPRIFPVKSVKGKYITTPSLVVVTSPYVSFAINAYDMVSAAANHYGIFESSLTVDEKSVLAFRMNNISYNDTRYLNAHIDYKTRATGGPWLQHLSELPGCTQSIYKKTGGDGVIDISDGSVHSVKILVKDAYKNSCTLKFDIQYKEGIGNTVLPGESKMFYPAMLDGYESDECEFFIGERSLYDSVHIRYNKSGALNTLAVSSVHSIGEAYIPLQEAFLIRLKADRPLTDAQKQKVVMQWYSGSRNDVQKVVWQSEWASARFRDFGSYQLLIDEEPPAIVPINFSEGSNLQKASQIVFTVRDNLVKFKNVRAELDAKWIRFTNDKGRTFIYRFDEKCPPGPHQLKITAEDEAGNISSKVFSFTR